MATTNQKSIMDSTHKNKKVSNAHTKKKKESQPQHEDSHQITREQKKKGEKNQKTLEKVIQNN